MGASKGNPARSGHGPRAATNSPRLVRLLALGLGLTGACGSTSIADVFSLSGDASVPSVPGTTVDGGSGADAAASSDGATPQDAGRVDARPDAPTPVVDAGDTEGLCSRASGATCDLKSNVCCRQPATDLFLCQAAALPCVGLKIPCAEEADCPKGNVCCGTVSGGAVVGIQCRKPTECRNNQNRVILCNADDADPCPIEGVCQASVGTLVGYDLCLN